MFEGLLTDPFVLLEAGILGIVVICMLALPALMIVGSLQRSNISLRQKIDQWTLRLVFLKLVAIDILALLLYLTHPMYVVLRVFATIGLAIMGLACFAVGRMVFNRGAGFNWKAEKGANS